MQSRKRRSLSSVNLNPEKITVIAIDWCQTQIVKDPARASCQNLLATHLSKVILASRLRGARDKTLKVTQFRQFVRRRKKEALDLLFDIVMPLQADTILVVREPYMG